MIKEKSPEFWRATLALGCGSFMIFSNLYVTQPLLPEFKTIFEISSLEANASLALTSLTLGLSLLFYGPLSDALGRKNIMLITMLGVVVVTFLLAWAPNYPSLLVLRAIQGFLLGGLPAIAIGYMGDEFSKKAVALAVGFYIAANSLGGINGRLFSGWMADVFDWRASFFAAGCLSLVCLAIFWWALPPSRHFQPQRFGWSSFVRPLGLHLRHPLLLVAYLIGGLNFFIFVNQYSYITYLLAGEPWQLASRWLGLLFLTYLSGTWAASISGRVALVLAQPYCMALGIGLMLLGSGITLFPNLISILLGLLISSFGFFFCHSNASSWVSRQATEARASASSLYLVFYYLGASSGAFYLDPFWRWAAWPGVVAGSVMILLITLGCSLWLARQDGRTLNQLHAAPSHKMP
ncbi:MFS transporter [Marinospirillum sp.]|uniref:MFS transporter n=1 Tax=Marinospirillum sp. TaxID=2183934 RepID=UPI003A844CD8